MENNYFKVLGQNQQENSGAIAKLVRGESEGQFKVVTE